MDHRDTIQASIRDLEDAITHARRALAGPDREDHLDMATSCAMNAIQRLETVPASLDAALPNQFSLRAR
jgi:hypothetical protein